MRPKTLVVLLATAFSVSIPAAAPAADPTTTIDQLDAVRNGDSIAVTGKASFGGLGLVKVGTDGTGDAAYNLPAAFGLDLIGASIGQPNPNTGDLEFVLDLEDLPSGGSAPEGTWYGWDLTIDPIQGPPVGFRVGGKRTDFAGPNPGLQTRSPAFKVSRCVGNDPCSFGTWVEAVMDGDANRITVTVPTSVLADIAGAPVDGATIRQSDFHYKGVIARTDPLVWSNQQPWDSYDRVPITGTHTVAARAVELDLVPAGGTPSFGSQSAIGDDGSFAKTFSTAGLASGVYDVWARAWFGTNCATRSVRVEL